MNEAIMRAMGLGAHVEAVKNGACPFCGKSVDPTSFKDELSRREFKISGLCQPCQDGFFDKEEE